MRNSTFIRTPFRKAGLRTNAVWTRLDYIDGLRGGACLYVLLYHLFLLWPVSSHDAGGGGNVLVGALTRFAAFGNIGVDVFLGISGFCLFYPLCQKVARTESIPSVQLKTYAVRRARRILPPYLAALVLFSVLPFWAYWAQTAYPAPSTENFVVHALLIHNVLPSAVLTIDSPLWSLALEAQLYVLFPLLVVLFRRLGVVRFAVATFAFSLLFRLVAWYGLRASTLPFEAQFTLMNALPARFHEFAAGMCAAYVLTHPGDLNRKSAGWLRMGAVVAIVFGLVLAYAADKVSGTYSPFTSIFWAVLTYGLIIGAAEGMLLPLRLFTWRPLVVVGLFSYSIYLVHEPLLRVTGPTVRELGLDPLLALCLFLATTGPLILAISAVYFLLFEKPFLKRRAYH